MVKKKEMTVSELARMGGKANLKKNGKGHYSKMAKVRWDKTKEERAKKKLKLTK